jgi:protoheme IX farnesyltransferase
VLGIASYFLIIQPFAAAIPFKAVLVITFHVATGALLLGLSLLACLVAYRTRPASSAAIKTTLTDYFTLTKPGISFMAGITALAGFVLGSNGDINYLKLFNTCIGTLMAAAGAGCLNMLIERDVDAQMRRTKTRPLPSGRLQEGEVLFLGVFLSIGGVLYLAWAVNFLSAFFGGLTLSIYLYIYTPLKKISAACVTVGAVAGALPPVMGWTAATGKVGVEALVLFGILFFWQFPHFLSLAWLYKEDYMSAGLHMLPGAAPEDRSTSRQILWNSVALLLVSCVPTLLGLTGIFYLLTALALGAVMTSFSFGFFSDHSRANAKRVFLFSLLYIPALVVLMLLNGSSPLWAS